MGFHKNGIALGKHRCRHGCWLGRRPWESNRVAQVIQYVHRGAMGGQLNVEKTL